MKKKSDKKRTEKVRIIKLKGNKGFGINEIIGIAAGVIIAVLIVMPGLRSFAGSVMSELSNWWSGIAGSLFS